MTRPSPMRPPSLPQLYGQMLVLSLSTPFSFTRTGTPRNGCGQENGPPFLFLAPEAPFGLGGQLVTPSLLREALAAFHEDDCSGDSVHALRRSDGRTKNLSSTVVLASRKFHVARPAGRRMPGTDTGTGLGVQQANANIGAWELGGLNEPLQNHFQVLLTESQITEEEHYHPHHQSLRSVEWSISALTACLKGWSHSCGNRPLKGRTILSGCARPEMVSPRVSVQAASLPPHPPVSFSPLVDRCLLGVGLDIAPFLCLPGQTVHPFRDESKQIMGSLWMDTSLH
ncbi:hypothetical protein V8F20_010750 [Naviculisporaceae sp. PSN 640]